MSQTTMPHAGLTRRIAMHVADVAGGTLANDDVEAVRRLMLDNFLVSLWGSTRPAATAIAGWSSRFAGTGACPVLGTDWSTEPATAALVHGTAAHSYELDDTHDLTTSHPGSVIIPAALAVATSLDSPQQVLFRAIAAGYEAMALIGTSAGGMETVHRGFHPTPVFGAFGAATACLCLHAFHEDRPVTAEALISLWGLALSLASGSMQFSLETTGGEIKRVHAGLGARNGVTAAEFSRLAPVTAPSLSVEGGYGVAALFGGPLRDVEPERQLQIHAISLKPYACCRLFHSTIDALREITDDFSLPVDSIDEILITGPRLIAEQHMTAARSTMTAQYSCPYIVGATLAYGPARYDVYGEDFLDDARIRRLAAKVRFQVDAGIEAAWYPRHYATGAKIVLADGSAREAVVIDSFGTARKPMSRDRIIAKADGLRACGTFPTGEALAATIWDPASSAPDLTRALTARG